MILGNYTFQISSIIIIYLIIVFNAVGVIFSKNSIHSIVFLVIVFLASAGLLFLLECEFFALIFLIIYVGAIAVLFLFAIMLLDLKNLTSNSHYSSKYFVFGILITLNFLFFVIEGVDYFCVSNPYDNIILLPNMHKTFFNEDVISEIFVIGQVLYTYYLLQFLLSGIILSLGVIGVMSFIITHQTTKKNL